MSIHALKWAWSQQCPNPTAKLVLVALADHANADGECWPTMKSVAALAGVSTRTVHDHIKALEGAGLVERGERRMHGGQFRGWTFHLPIASGSTPPVEDGRQRQEAAGSSGSELPVPLAADCRSGTVIEPPLNRQGGPPVDRPKTWDPAWRAVEQYVSRWGSLDPDRPPVPEWMTAVLRPLGGIHAVRKGEVNKWDFRDAFKAAA